MVHHGDLIAMAYGLQPKSDVPYCTHVTSCHVAQEGWTRLDQEVLAAGIMRLKGVCHS